MKKLSFLFFCFLLIVFSSCQKKQFAYFQKEATSVDYAYQKKVNYSENNDIKQPLVLASNSADIETILNKSVNEKSSINEDIVGDLEKEPIVLDKTTKKEVLLKSLPKWQQRVLNNKIKQIKSNYAKPVEPNYNKMGKVSAIVGIISIITYITSILLPSLPAILGILVLLGGITALVLGIMSVRKADKKGGAIIGIITGGLIVLMLFLAIIVLAALL